MRAILTTRFFIFLAFSATGFGTTMHQGGFQAALDQSEDTLRRVIQLLKPSVVVVASKGLNILTHLADTGIYTGPSVLLSPIPNVYTLVSGETWEEQWSASMSVLADAVDGPIGIGVGDSPDEQSLIKDMMDEAGVCGSLEEEVVGGRVSFRQCSNWFLRSFPGDHQWKNQRRNAINVASLIKEVLWMADWTDISRN
eukprot:CAMPEP_0194267778 /NCGR_PEP_ID=MMETSP0169-20130528/2217_1 /TAXON_ID=218684 /ORGANISM="Corethron pennatum, Strain L29A3" /LENGTH=196 /DNA_ID=CAMNT_0039008743 /DNA_START=102 /DNA_END=692 /DNA_ORIENTATION=-